MIFESFINNLPFLVFEIFRVGGVHSRKIPRRIGLNLILYLKISTSFMFINVMLLNINTSESSFLFPRHKKEKFRLKF